MDKEILLVLVGGTVGFFSSILSGLIAYFLENRRMRRQWEREDILRAEQRRHGEQERIQDFLQENRMAQFERQRPITVKPTRWYCFLPGTKITLSNGSQILIEELKVGNQLLSYDLGHENFMVDEVSQLHTRDISEYLILNHTIRVTSSHLFYVDGIWRTAKELRVGNKLFKSDQTWWTIESIELKIDTTNTYNIDLANNSPFFADGVLVNNQFEKEIFNEYGETASKDEQESESQSPKLTLQELKRRLDNAQEIVVDEQGHLIPPDT